VTHDMFEIYNLSSDLYTLSICWGYNVDYYECM